MRNLVIALIVVNLLVFAAGNYMDEITRFVGNITQPAADENSNDTATLDQQSPLSDTVATPEQTNAATVADKPAEETTTTLAAGESAASTNTAPTALPAEKPQTTAVPPADKPETATQTQPATQAATQPPSETKPDKPKRLACIEIGPVPKDRLDELKKILNPLPRDTQIRTYSKVSPNDPFWVFLPAAKNLAEQQKQIAMLKEHGVKDYFIVQTSGNDKGAVSLGVFKSRQRANARQKEMVEKGINAHVAQKTTNISYVRITQAPENIKQKYDLIRRRFNTVHTIASCKP